MSKQNKYELIDYMGNKPEPDQCSGLHIRNDEGELLIWDVEDATSTDNRKKLDEMIELANEAAALRKIKEDYWKGKGL